MGKLKKTFKPPPQVSLLLDVPDHDADLGHADEDATLLEDYKGYTGFLSTLNPEELTKNQLIPTSISKFLGASKNLNLDLSLPSTPSMTPLTSSKPILDDSDSEIESDSNSDSNNNSMKSMDLLSEFPILQVEDLESNDDLESMESLNSEAEFTSDEEAEVDEEIDDEDEEGNLESDSNDLASMYLSESLPYSKEEVEESYEMGTRVASTIDWSAPSNTRLPIKMEDGSLQIPTKPQDQSHRKPSHSLPPKVTHNIPLEPQLTVKRNSSVNIDVLKLSSAEAQEYLAEVASGILENPEQNV